VATKSSASTSDPVARRHRGAQSLDDLGRERPLREVAVPQPTRDAREGVQVGDADTPARAGEQAHELGARGGIVEHGERADEVADLGLLEQTADAEHVERHPRLPQGGEEDRLGRARAHEQSGAR